MPRQVAPPTSGAHRPAPPSLNPHGSGDAWQDERPLDSGWDAPRWHDRFTMAQKLLASVLAVALLAAGLWVGGAFKRQATVTRVDWRTPVISGPVEIRVLSASYEPRDDGGQVTVLALCRLAVPSATRVQSLDVQQGVTLVLDNQVVPHDARRARFVWSSLSALDREELAPEVPATPCQITAHAPPTYRPGPIVDLVAFRQYYSERDQAQAGGPGWRVSRGGVRMSIPLVVLQQRR